MKIVYNYIIPFKGFLAMCIFPFIFVRKDARNLTVKDINHEKIHGRQQIEMLWLLFFVWYGIEYMVRWICYGFDGRLAYRNIGFEQEAYLNEDNEFYITKRKLYSWIKYLPRKSFVRDHNSGKIVKKQ